LKNKKAELVSDLSSGSSAIFFPTKIRRFPYPPYERFGFIGIVFLNLFLRKEVGKVNNAG
jgi:hypothetical protein